MAVCRQSYPNPQTQNYSDRLDRLGRSPTLKPKTPTPTFKTLKLASSHTANADVKPQMLNLVGTEGGCLRRRQTPRLEDVQPQCHLLQLEDTLYNSTPLL